MNFKSRTAIEISDHNEVKAKLGHMLICNRVCDICQEIQCPHNRPHEHDQDCRNKTCQRDNRQQIVNCVIMEEDK
jgi:hypothetical protein